MRHCKSNATLRSVGIRQSCLLVVVALALMVLNGCKPSYRLNALVLTASKFDVAFAEIEAAAKAWGNAAGGRVIVDAPALPTSASQQALLEEYLSQDWDIICVEPLSVAGLSPLLENAQDRGSVIVALNEKRLLIADCAIEPFSTDRLGEAMMDTLAATLHSNGLYITLLPSFAAENILNMEIAAIRLQRQKYASMMVVDRLSETGGEAAKARHIVEDSIQRHSINGLLFFTSADGQGAAGNTDANENRVAAVGLGELKILGKYIADGLIDTLFYWEKNKLVLAGLEIGHEIISGQKLNGDVFSLPIEGYETLRHAGGNVWEAYAVKVLKRPEY